MELEIFWHRPLPLEEGSDKDWIFDVRGLDDFEGKSGVYMFCRNYSGKLIPLYIGKALDIRSRIHQHLNTTKLMIRIQKAKSGKKVVVIGEFKSKPGQDKEAAIKLIEKALIRYALSEGYQLLNKAGTNMPVHNINFSGNLEAKDFSGREILLEK